jgi:hypothetical protein
MAQSSNGAARGVQGACSTDVTTAVSMVSRCVASAAWSHSTMRGHNCTSGALLDTQGFTAVAMPCNLALRAWAAGGPLRSLRPAAARCLTTGNSEVEALNQVSSAG